MISIQYVAYLKKKSKLINEVDSFLMQDWLLTQFYYIGGIEILDKEVFIRACFWQYLSKKQMATKMETWEKFKNRAIYIVITG